MSPETISYPYIYPEDPGQLGSSMPRSHGKRRSAATAGRWYDAWMTWCTRLLHFPVSGALRVPIRTYHHNTPLLIANLVLVARAVHGCDCDWYRCCC